MNGKLARQTLVVLVLGYGAVMLVARGFVDSMLYFPEYGSRRAPMGAVQLKMDDGAALSAVYLPNLQAQLTIWYFHGNAEDLGDIESRLKAWQARGFAVFAYDYPGYGASGGSPNEKAIYAANAVAKKYLTETLRVPLDRVVLYGRSLGGGAATDLASREAVAGLILESTFTSVYRVMTRWPLVPGDQFKNAAKISQVKCPVLILHGRYDGVIPFHHGETLFKRANEPKQSFWADGAGHNNVEATAGAEYERRLAAFLAPLAKSP